MAALICLLLGLCGVVSGQSLIGASLPCQETDRDPDVNNPMDNLICPFTNETCITTSQICDCLSAAQFSRLGSGSGSGLLHGESDENFLVHSIDCSKSLPFLPFLQSSSKFHVANPSTKGNQTQRERLAKASKLTVSHS